MPAKANRVDDVGPIARRSGREAFHNGCTHDIPPAGTRRAAIGPAAPYCCYAEQIRGVSDMVFLHRCTVKLRQLTELGLRHATDARASAHRAVTRGFGERGGHLAELRLDLCSGPSAPRVRRAHARHPRQAWYRPSASRLDRTTARRETQLLCRSSSRTAMRASTSATSGSLRAVAGNMPRPDPAMHQHHGQREGQGILRLRCGCGHAREQRRGLGNVFTSIRVTSPAEKP